MCSADVNNDGNPPASMSETRAKKDTESGSETFVASFIKAKKDRLLFPSDNPVVIESTNKLLEQLRESFSSEKLITLLVEKDRLLVNGSLVSAKDPRIGQFRLSLYKCGVQKIILQHDTPQEEIRFLIETINKKPEEIARAGGVVSIFEKEGLKHVAVEGSAALTIVDGDTLATPDEMIPELEDIEDMELAIEHADRLEGFSRMFVRAEEGDFANLERFRSLLRDPALFTKLLEKFALQLEKVEEGVDAVRRAEHILKILDAVGAAIETLPSEEERSGLMKNLATSVLGLSASLRADVVNEGLVPNLNLKSIECSILSRFPTAQLAEALLENFEVSGGAASLMQSYFGNLELSLTEKAALAETLRNRLSTSGMLTPEVKTVLTEDEDETGGAAEPDKSSVAEAAGLPRLEGYPPEKILFHGDERRKLVSQIMEEFEAPPANVMAPAVLQLMRHEETPMNHAALVARAMSHMDYFLTNRNYGGAAMLIKGLQAELEHKKQIFSGRQVAPLQDAVDEHLGEDKMRELIGAFENLNREDESFENLIQYFDAIGSPAISALVKTLEESESRHVRLLTCHALARLEKRAMVAVAKNIDHPNWYVVRNTVSVLSQIGKPECIPYLRKALAHENMRVKKEALKGLASIRTAEAVGLVCQCLGGEDVEMCKAALEWIAAIEAEQAMPALETLLDGKNMWRKNADVVKLAIEALGSIGSEAAKRFLEGLTQVRSLFRRRRAALIRKGATAALRGGKRIQRP